MAKCKTPGCENDVASAVSNSYCYQCYKKHSDSKKEKQSKSARERHERDRAEKRAAEIQMDVVAEEIVFPTEFNLEEKYEDYKALGLAGTGDYYNEMFSFAAWLNADARTRQPVYIQDVAKILNVDVGTLKRWKNSGTIKKIRKKVIDHNMRYDAYPLFMSQVVRGIGRGDKESMRVYESMFIASRDDDIKDDSDIDEGVLEEASSIVEENGLSTNNRVNLKGATRQTTERMVVDRLIDHS